MTEHVIKPIPLITITNHGAGLFPNRFVSVDNPVATGTQLKTLDGFYTSRQTFPRPVVDYSIFSKHVIDTDDFGLFPWFFHKTPLTAETVQLVMGMVSDADPPNLKLAASKSHFMSATISIAPVSDKASVGNQMLNTRYDTYNETKDVFTERQGAEIINSTDAFLNSESFRKIHRGTYALAPMYPVFYRLLSTRMFDVPNVRLRRRLHEMNQTIVNDDFHEVCKMVKDVLVKSTGNRSNMVAIMLQCVQCLYGLIYNGDYAGYPRTPELIECMLDMLFTECIRLGTDSYNLAIKGVFTGRVEIRPDIPSALDTYSALSLRAMFKWTGLSAGDVEDIFSNSVVWSSCSLFFATANITPSLTRMQIIDIHNNKNTALQGAETQSDMIRRSTIVSIEMLASLMVPVVHDNPEECKAEMEYGCMLVMVHTVVAHLFMPLLNVFRSEYMADFLPMGPAAVWPVFTLGFDFAANLAALAVLWRRQTVVSQDIWTRLMRGICDRVRDNAQARTKELITQQTEFPNKNLYDYATSMLVNTPLYADNDNLNTLFQSGINVDNEMTFTEFVSAICDAWQFTAERVDQYKSVMTIERPKDAQHVNEPIVKWEKTPDNLLVLIDPEFYVYYLVMRLVYNVTDAPPGTFNTFNRYYAQISLYLPHIVSFAFNVFYPRFLYAVKAVSGKIEDVITKRYPCPRKSVVFSGQTNSPDGVSVNIMHTLPVFTHAHRIDALKRLFLHLFVRFEGDHALIAAVTGDYDPGFDMDAALSLFSGSAFMTADGLCSGSVGNTMSMYHHARALGLKMAKENTTKLTARRASVESGATDNRVVIPLTRAALHEKKPRYHRIGFLVSLVGCFASNVDKSSLECYWVWTPSQDTQKRSFRFTQTVTLKANSDGKFGIVALDVPIVDGMEGEYSLVVGSHAIGYVRNSVYVAFEKKCVRTGRVYQEIYNTSANARWMYDGAECIGWYSDETQLPYSTYFPPSVDVTTALVDELQPYFGDTLTIHSHLRPLMFASRPNWLFFCDYHTQRTLVSYVFDFFAQRAVGRSSRYINTAYRTAIELLDAMRITPLRLKTYQTDQFYVNWFRMLELPPNIQTRAVIDTLAENEREYEGSRPFSMFDNPTQRHIYGIYNRGVIVINRTPMNNATDNPSPTPHSSPSGSVSELISVFDNMNIADNVIDNITKALKPIIIDDDSGLIDDGSYDI